MSATQSLVAPRFDAYKDNYENVSFERDERGVLTMTLGTRGGLVWSALAHEELPYAFNDVANDRDNAAVILTGTGDAFCEEIDAASFKLATARDWDQTIYDGRRLLENFLDIEVPVIAAVNGPVRFHPEIPVSGRRGRRVGHRGLPGRAATTCPGSSRATGRTSSGRT